MPTVTKRVEKNITYKFTGKKDELGAGAFGKVYKWKRIDDGKEEYVAVKTMKMSRNEKKDKDQQYEKEVLFYLNEGKHKHPNIVNLLETFTDDSSFGNVPHICFVMEFASGGDLKGRLKTKLSIKIMASVIKQILMGLAFLEDSRIVHNDIKPANILLVKEGRWQTKISDFGLAKMLPKGVREINSSMGGTMPYLGPEYRDDRFGYALDIWATGVTMWNMFIGSRAYPFDCDASFQRRYQPPNYRLKMWDENPDAADLVRRMFIMDPVERIRAKEALKHKWIVDYTSPKKKEKARPKPSGVRKTTKETKRKETKHRETKPKETKRKDSKQKEIKRDKNSNQSQIEKAIEKQMKMAQQVIKSSARR